ncbi:hypothetical protein HDU93_004567, partial [Gonapodya sp. JEL0774]
MSLPRAASARYPNQQSFRPASQGYSGATDTDTSASSQLTWLLYIFILAVPPLLLYLNKNSTSASSTAGASFLPGWFPGVSHQVNVGGDGGAAGKKKKRKAAGKTDDVGDGETEGKRGSVPDGVDNGLEKKDGNSLTGTTGDEQTITRKTKKGKQGTSEWNVSQGSLEEQ